MQFIKLDERATIPTRATKASAGYDLKALDGFVLMPRQRLLVPTGLSIRYMNPRAVGLIKDKSGLAHKFGLTTLAGVIDADYTGDIGVILLNTGNDVVTFKAGQSIAQLVVVPYYTFKEEVLVERDGGFGSTNN